MGTTFDVLYGAGDGTFPTRRSFAAPANAQGVAAADLNRDGWTDIVLASTTGVISVYTFNASGATRQNLSLGESWNIAAIGDVDADGRLDLIVESTAASVVQILAQASPYGTWTRGVQMPVASSPRGLQLADINRDGRLDIVTAGRASSTVSVLTRTTASVTTAAGWQRTEFGAGAGARDVAVVEFSHDGRPDILTANEQGHSATLLQNTTPLPTAAYIFDELPLPVLYDNSTFAVGDFNSNGSLDIVRRNSVLFDLHTESPRMATTPGGSLAEAAAAADFNRDGKLDVVFSKYQDVLVFFGDGAGNFTDGPSMTTGGFVRQIRQADFNRDG